MNLEAQTRKFLQDLKALGGPPLQQRSVADARQFLSSAQATPVPMAPARVERHTVAAGPTGGTRLVIVRPEGQSGTLPALMYVHGGGWILGDWPTHERLVRELAARIPAVVVFVDYERAPEQPYPVGIEQAYAALGWVVAHASDLGIDPRRVAIAGDSVGGNMATVVTMLAKERRGPALVGQVLFYPVTNADFETPSYQAFAEGTNLTRDAMRWFWDAYMPDPRKRRDPHAAPLLATLQQLERLPPALVITGENDVLRDEGEAYVSRLSEAGVVVTGVRYSGTVHDFVMLNALARTPAAMAATTQAIDWLAQAFQQTPTREGRPGSVTFMPAEVEATRRTP